MKQGFLRGLCAIQQRYQKLCEAVSFAIKLYCHLPRPPAVSQLSTTIRWLCTIVLFPFRYRILFMIFVEGTRIEKTAAIGICNNQLTVGENHSR